MEIDKFNNYKYGLYNNVYYKGHFIDGSRVGYFLGKSYPYKCHYNSDGEVIGCIAWYKCHYNSDGEVIGCIAWNERQYFFNKSGKQFGEEVKWK